MLLSRVAVQLQIRFLCCTAGSPHSGAATITFLPWDPNIHEGSYSVCCYANANAVCMARHVSRVWGVAGTRSHVTVL